MGWTEDIYTLSRASHISSSAVCSGVVSCCSLSFTSCHLSWELKRKNFTWSLDKRWWREARAKRSTKTLWVVMMIESGKDDIWQSVEGRESHTHIRVVAKLFLPRDHWVVSEWSDFKKLLSLHQFHFTEERDSSRWRWKSSVHVQYTALHTHTVETRELKAFYRSQLNGAMKMSKTLFVDAAAAAAATVVVQKWWYSRMMMWMAAMLQGTSLDWLRSVESAELVYFAAGYSPAKIR